METKILTVSKQDIEKAGEIIRNGGLVAFPTETVYGLGANALSPEAVRSIYAAKGRPCDNPLIVHIAEKDDIIPLVREVTPEAKALIDAFFPAPLTVILKKSDVVPDVTSGGLDTVAVRMPENETARALIKASGVPVAAPSANTSGLPSPTKAQHVIDDMSGKIDAIIDGGECSVGVESTVITLAGEIPTILRPGAVTKEMLERVLGRVEIADAVLHEMDSSEKAASPGMKYKHYAPKAKIVLVNAEKEDYERFVNAQKHGFALCFEGDGVKIRHLTYGRENDDAEQARELFDRLRQLDELGAKTVFARMPHTDGVGMAVYNRLIRAAAFRIIDLKKPFRIGITGPTGAGKGYCCEYLSEKFGFQIISADAAAREVVREGSPLLKELQEAFGADILTSGTLDRKLLAQRAFASREKTDLLNSVMHPAIAKCLRSSVGNIYNALDAPQLFEAGLGAECYKVITVTAPESVRLERIKSRDGITNGEALLRINAQHPEEYYTQKSDFVVINDGKADVTAQLDRILDEILYVYGGEYNE